MISLTAILPADNQGLGPLQQAIMNIFQGYVMLIVLVFGIFGNTLSFIIFFRARRREDASVQYSSVLSLSDTAVILFYGGVMWLGNGLLQVTNGVYSINLLATGPSCKCLLFLGQMTACISALIIVCFSIERAFVVWFPLRRSEITSNKRKFIMIVVTTLSICLSIHLLILIDTHYVGEEAYCSYSTSSFIGGIIFQLEVAMTNYIPFTLIFFSNVMIVLGIARARRSDTGKVSQSANQQQENRMIVSLMLVSTLYIIFLMPASTMYTYFLFVARESSDNQEFRNYVNLLLNFSMLNYCLNFVIYGCTLPFYRSDARKIFKCKWSQTL